jgi:hypothetical protein
MGSHGQIPGGLREGRSTEDRPHPFGAATLFGSSELGTSVSTGRVLGAPADRAVRLPSSPPSRGEGGSLVPMRVSASAESLGRRSTSSVRSVT